MQSQEQWRLMRQDDAVEGALPSKHHHAKSSRKKYVKKNKPASNKNSANNNKNNKLYIYTLRKGNNREHNKDYISQSRGSALDDEKLWRMEDCTRGSSLVNHEA